MSSSLDASSYSIGNLVFEQHENKKQNKIHKVIKDKEGQKIFRQIGNFVINIIAKGEDMMGHPIYLINLNGELKIDTLSFTSSINKFREYIRPYTFNGNSDDLELMVELMTELIRSDNDEILLPIKDYVGLYNHPKITFWIFDSLLFLTHIDQERLATAIRIVLPPNGILHFEDLKVWVSIDQSNINKALIPVYKEPDVQYKLIDHFLPDWLSQVKNKTLLYALLGWGIASLYLEHVNKLRQSRFFPFFVITAATEAGKTSLLANCIKVFGFEYIGENFASSVTLFVEVVESARVSHLPIWRDEYKNEKHALMKEGWLRSMYTRSSASRGSKDQKIKEYPTNATLLLSGEDITEDPALYRRMVKMRLRGTDKISKENFRAITKKANTHFGTALPMILSQPFNDDIFLRIFNNDDNMITGDTDLKDELMCYATLGAIFGEEVGLEAIREAKEYHKLTQDDAMNEKQVTVDDFFLAIDSLFIEKNSFESLYNQRPKALDYFYFPPLKPGTVYIKFIALYTLIMKYKSSSDYKWSKKALAQLIIEAYEGKMEARRFNEESCRVMIINDYTKYADTFGDLMTKISAIQEQYDTFRTTTL